jgi:hypothetical protein
MVFGWDLPACLSLTEETARTIERCLQGVMHPPDGRGPKVMEAEAAALACRRARSPQAADALAGCVRGLLHERSGLGARREAVDPDSAALACGNATDEVARGAVEECVLRLLYTRSGLGYERTEVDARTAARACQTVAAPAPAGWAWYARCRPPSQLEASRFLEDCTRRVMFHREGLGPRREGVSARAAVLACEGALVE